MYQTLGSGFPLVHMAGIPWNSLELEWHVPAWRGWHQRLVRRMLVRYDNRGEGLSDRRDARVTLQSTVLDLESVVDVLDFESFDIYAPPHTSLAAIEFAGLHPQRVRKMVLRAVLARVGTT